MVRDVFPSCSLFRLVLFRVRLVLSDGRLAGNKIGVQVFVECDFLLADLAGFYLSNQLFHIEEVLHRELRLMNAGTPEAGTQLHCSVSLALGVRWLDTALDGAARRAAPHGSTAPLRPLRRAA